jgi:hypothetical protein
MSTTRATQTKATQAIADCDRVELQYIYSPGDRYGTRYVVTVDGWQDRTWLGAGTVVFQCAALNAGQDV